VTRRRFTSSTIADALAFNSRIPIDGLPKSVFERRLLLVRGVVAARIVVTSDCNETTK